MPSACVRSRPGGESLLILVLPVPGYHGKTFIFRPNGLWCVPRYLHVHDEWKGRHMTGPRDFFITYNGKDESRATWIAATLEGSGYTTTIQAWDFRPGDNFIAAMDRALATCRHTLGVLSPNYLASVFTRAEWTAAYRQTLIGKPRAFIGVRIADCDLTPLLGALAYIDLVGVDESEARRRLLEGVADRVDRDPGGFSA
jgi:TIR domain